jgi:hypothetical protein
VAFLAVKYLEPLFILLAKLGRQASIGSNS